MRDPALRRCAANASTASTGPDTTHCSGPLTAATASVGGSCAASSSSAIDTDSIAPAAPASPPRAATRPTASSSENTPRSTRRPVRRGGRSGSPASPPAPPTPDTARTRTRTAAAGPAPCRWCSRRPAGTVRAPARPPREPPAHVVERGAEHRVLAMQVARHPGGLRALPGEQENHRARGRRVAGGRPPARGQRVERRVARLGDHERPARVVLPGGLQRMRDVGERPFRVAAPRGGEAVRRAPQPSGVAADSRRQCAAAAVGASASGGAASRITCALVPPMPNELTARAACRRPASRPLPR